MKKFIGFGVILSTLVASFAMAGGFGKKGILTSVTSADIPDPYVPVDGEMNITGDFEVSGISTLGAIKTTSGAIAFVVRDILGAYPGIQGPPSASLSLYASAGQTVYVCANDDATCLSVVDGAATLSGAAVNITGTTVNVGTGPGGNLILNVDPASNSYVFDGTEVVQRWATNTLGGEGVAEFRQYISTDETVYLATGSGPGGIITFKAIGTGGAAGFDFRSDNGASTVTFSDMSVITNEQVFIDGSIDEIQLKVQGHSTQTTLPFVVENSAGTDVFTVSNIGLATAVRFVTAAGGGLDTGAMQFGAGGSGYNIGSTTAGQAPNAISGLSFYVGRTAGPTSTNSAFANGTVAVDTTAVGNVGTGEDTLKSFTLSANSFDTANAGAVGGRVLKITAMGTTSADIETKTLKLKWGSATILTTTLTGATAQKWALEAYITKTGTDTQDYSTKLTETGLTTDDIENGSTTEDDGATITVLLTGETSVGANNSIVMERFQVEVMN